MDCSTKHLACTLCTLPHNHAVANRLAHGMAWSRLDRHLIAHTHPHCLYGPTGTTAHMSNHGFLETSRGPPALTRDRCNTTTIPHGRGNMTQIHVHGHASPPRLHNAATHWRNLQRETHTCSSLEWGPTEDISGGTAVATGGASTLQQPPSQPRNRTTPPAGTAVHGAPLSDPLETTQLPRMLTMIAQEGGWTPPSPSLDLSLRAT